LCNNAIDEPIDNGANNTRNYRVNGKNERTRLSALTARGCPTAGIRRGAVARSEAEGGSPVACMPVLGGVLAFATHFLRRQ
jgi:hypothetical protein